MSEICINSIKIKNYRSFSEEQEFVFPKKDYKKPIAIVGYNNSGKTNLINALLYGIGYKFVSENTFTKSDLHNLNYNNLIQIETDIEATSYIGKNWQGQLETKTVAGKHRLYVEMDDAEMKTSMRPSFFGAIKHYNIFFINFHNIKDEISTQKSSWGILKSFLAKHIQKIVENDLKMKKKKEDFERETKNSTDSILKDSDLSEFIKLIKKNYTTNLRENNCEVVFGLPDYEDIFLQMMFKVGLNCDDVNELVPISHFGDGYISMFIMAVIQAIAETDTNDKCLFIFEEPESFLHENHQDYFYKIVLCNLSERGHQVIYTTHSDRMVDIFDTRGIIRIEFDEKNKQTIKKFNDPGIFSPGFDSSQEEFEEIVGLNSYNSFIKSIEPNLNKILFSRKVLLVEGPNDVLAYKYAIEKKVKNFTNDKTYAETYLSFLNIAIVPHHGKSTALLLIKLCKHFKLDYFVINDWDLDDDFVSELSMIESRSDLKQSRLYLFDGTRERTDKSMIMMNWNLIKAAGLNNIHFNIKKLETVLEYSSNDKSSVGIWNRLNEIETFSYNFFPPRLEQFLEFDKIKRERVIIQTEEKTQCDVYNDLPF